MVPVHSSSLVPRPIRGRRDGLVQYMSLWCSDLRGCYVMGQQSWDLMGGCVQASLKKWSSYSKH